MNKPPLVAQFSSATVGIALVCIILLTALVVSPLRAALDLLGQELSNIAALIKEYSPADPEVGRKANEALQQSAEEGDSFKLGTSLIQLHRSASFNGNHRQGYEYSRQILLLPAPILDAGFRTWGHVFEAESLFLLGKPGESYNQTRTGLLHYDPSQQKGFTGIVGVDAKAGHLAYAGLTLWLLGYPDQAVREGTEAVEWARQINHPYSLAFALNLRSIVYQWRGDSKQSRHDAEEAIRTSSGEQTFPYYLAMGTILQGSAMADEGETAKGSERIQEGLRLRPPQGRVAQTYFQVLLAGAYGKAEMPQAGIEELKRAQANIDATEERFFEAEVNRLRGELLRQAGASDQEAEQYFLKALDIARTQRAKSLELRAATSLARLWRVQGKEEEGRLMLAKIYAEFSEGLETKELREAKTLLTTYP